MRLFLSLYLTCDSQHEIAIHYSVLEQVELVMTMLILMVLLCHFRAYILVRYQYCLE